MIYENLSFEQDRYLQTVSEVQDLRDRLDDSNRKIELITLANNRMSK